MSKAAIRHVDIAVDDIEASYKFYKSLLGLLGWSLEQTIKGERSENLTYLSLPIGYENGALGLRRRQSNKHAKPYDRYDLGLHHIAFNADSRKEVDKIAEWLRKYGYKIEAGPAEFYKKNYYAVFFYDPDGIKLEVVYGS